MAEYVEKWDKFTLVEPVDARWVTASVCSISAKSQIFLKYLASSGSVRPEGLTEEVSQNSHALYDYFTRGFSMNQLMITAFENC